MSDEKPENKRTVGTRLPEQTIHEIDDYADKRDISRSDALRQMILEGKEILAGDKIATDGGLHTTMERIEQNHRQQAKLQTRLLAVITAFAVSVIYLFLFAETAVISIVTAILGIIAVLTFVLTKKGY